MIQEKWVVTTKKADFNAISEKYDISPMLARIIRNRDVISEEEVGYYLHGKPEDMHDPRQMHHMELGAEILLKKIMEHKKIHVIGDYDVDGICATYILKRGLKQLGGEISAAIPHRVRDGYGLNEQLIQEAHREGIDTIVTCDNGIAAAQEIRMAKELGMTVIVTDHHEVPFEERGEGRREVLPPADAVIDPKQDACSYPYKGICGAMVAYKLIQLMVEKVQGHVSDDAEIRENQEMLQELMEFATIATICDVMELLDENRLLVKYGLKYMEESRNIGLRTLIKVCGLEGAKIGNYHVGFVLGPCLNATGRLDSAARALELFEAEHVREAVVLATDLKEMNESRKKMTEKGVEDAICQVEAFGYQSDKVLVIYLEDCHESIAGIIAGRLREKYYKPVYVLTDGEEGLKGSGRSIEKYSMYEALHEVEDLLDKYGGHKMAAGFSLQKTNLKQFRERLNHNCTLNPEDYVQKIKIDIPMPIPYATKEFVKELALLEPYGNGNPKPVFAQKGLRITNCKIKGKNKNVAGFTLADERGYLVEGIYFGEAETFAQQVERHMGRINVIYYPDVNEFRGNKTLQLVVTNYNFAE